MSGTERIFLGIFVINAITAVCYYVWNAWFPGRHRERRMEYLFKAVVMLLCPVVGPAFFLCGQLFYCLFFRQDVDLEDVIFSKERVRTHLRADEEREGNLAPIEEALAISDKDSLRTLVMNVVRGDVKNSLASIALALNSEDTETAHYAAAVLGDALNEFRKKAQELLIAMRCGEENAAEYAQLLIEYMNGVLAQGVLHEQEQSAYVDWMEEACTLLYEKGSIKARYIEWLCALLLGEKEFERMRRWCQRSRELYPDELSTYTCFLKLYFTTGRRQEFFEELNRLKSSEVVIDRETLELIRTFR